MVCVKGDDGGAMLCLTAGRCRHHRPRANVPPSHRSRTSGLWCRTRVCLLRHAPPPIVANQLRPVPRGAPSLTVTPFRAQPAPPNPVLPLTHSFPPRHLTTTTTLPISIPSNTHSLSLSLSLTRVLVPPLSLCGCRSLSLIHVAPHAARVSVSLKARIARPLSDPYPTRASPLSFSIPSRRYIALCPCRSSCVPPPLSCRAPPHHSRIRHTYRLCVAARLLHPPDLHATSHPALPPPPPLPPITPYRDHRHHPLPTLRARQPSCRPARASCPRALSRPCAPPPPPPSP